MRFKVKQNCLHNSIKRISQSSKNKSNHKNKTNQHLPMFNQEDLQNILTLINFHEDWDEVKELYDIDLNSLFDKVHTALDNTND